MVLSYQSFIWSTENRTTSTCNWQGLTIDSLEDIAVNKIHTLSVKPRERDFVDIFFIFKKKKFSLKELISLAKVKFDWHIDPIQFNQKDMENFFLRLAKLLEADIFK